MAWGQTTACTSGGAARHSKPPPVAPPPAVVTAPPVAAPCPPVAPPAPPPDPRAPDLVRGDSAFDHGNLAGAAAAYDAFLSGAGDDPEVPRVLARLVVLCSLPPTRDPVAARDYHQRLVSDFPQSTYRAEADLVLRTSSDLEAHRKRALELEREVARLNQLVEKLKEIDLKKPPG